MDEYGEGQNKAVCSFCGRTESILDDHIFLTAKSVAICDVCVDKAATIIRLRDDIGYCYLSMHSLCRAGEKFYFSLAEYLNCKRYNSFYVDYALRYMAKDIYNDLFPGD